MTVFIGSEPRSVVFASLEKHGCQDVVRWMGIQSQSALPSYYHAADLLFSINIKHTNVVLYEALAAGLPVCSGFSAQEAGEAEKMD